MPKCAEVDVKVCEWKVTRQFIGGKVPLMSASTKCGKSVGHFVVVIAKYCPHCGGLIKEVR